MSNQRSDYQVRNDIVIDINNDVKVRTLKYGILKLCKIIYKIITEWISETIRILNIYCIIKYYIYIYIYSYIFTTFDG